MPKVKTTMGFDFMRELTEQEVAATLDMEEATARELLDGVFAFEPYELRRLAIAKGLPPEELIRVTKLFER